MKSVKAPLIVALLVAILILCGLMVYGLGTVVGEYRPQLAKPFSDWALAIVLPLRQAHRQRHV
jgi:hypothetical protein